MKDYEKISRDNSDPIPGPLSAMVGLLLHPGDTSENLLQQETPPYVILMFLFAVTTICLPILVEMSRGTIPRYHIQMVLSLVCMYTLLVLIFVVFETVLLFLLGIRNVLTKVTAAAIYSLIPMIVVVWVFYALSYFSTGGLGFMASLLDGTFQAGDPRMKALPYAIVLAQLAVFIVFSHALRALGDLYYVNALILAIISILPLQAAAMTAGAVMDMVSPGISTLAPDMLGLKTLIEFAGSLFIMPEGGVLG